MNPIVIRTTLWLSVCTLVLFTVCTSAWAYAHPSNLDKYKGIWITTDQSIKIVVTGDSDPNRLNLAYFNKPDLLKTPYTRSTCAQSRGDADGIACNGGLWFALRGDGKLATNEETHPPGGGTVYFLFEKVTPKP